MPCGYIKKINKMECSRCKKEIKKIETIKNKDLKSMGITKRTNYPFGKNSKGNTTLFCSCGGVFC